MSRGTIDRFLNINAHIEYDLWCPPGHRARHAEDLLQCLPPSLAQLEFSHAPEIPIPPAVLERYARFRPTPLFRATAFERAIGSGCEIYIKNESVTPCGTHKANSAILIAHLCRDDAVQTVTTETTGNWGVALAQAATEVGMSCVCFVDSWSARERGQLLAAISAAGGRAVVVPVSDERKDLLELSANAAILATRSMTGATYVFGSVYGYFVVPQSIVGLEIKRQLAVLGRHPDVIVGSCGGGANLLGTVAPFLIERIAGSPRPRIISAESVACPILSQGRMGRYGIDSLGHFPQLDTYGLAGIDGTDYIGGLGSTVVATAAAHLHRRGLIEVRTVSAAEAERTAACFESTQEIAVAVESRYQLAALVSVTRELRTGVLVTNVSGAAPTFSGTSPFQP